MAVLSCCHRCCFGEWSGHVCCVLPEILCHTQCKSIFRSRRVLLIQLPVGIHCLAVASHVGWHCAVRVCTVGQNRRLPCHWLVRVVLGRLLLPGRPIVDVWQSVWHCAAPVSHCLSHQLWCVATVLTPAADSMYTLGYSFFYGAALICNSYAVFAVSLVAHVAQMLFLMLVENPHIEKTYNTTIVDEVKSWNRLPIVLGGVVNIDLMCFFLFCLQCLLESLLMTFSVIFGGAKAIARSTKKKSIFFFTASGHVCDWEKTLKIDFLMFFWWFR